MRGARPLRRHVENDRVIPMIGRLDADHRLAIVSLKNGSPDRGTIQLLEGLGADDEEDKELRDAAAKVAQSLKKKAKAR